MASLTTVYATLTLSHAIIFAFFTITLVTLFSIILQVTSKVRRGHEVQKQLSAFPGPPVHWLWGNVHEVKTIHDIIRLGMVWLHKYGPDRVARNGPWLWELGLAHPESVKTILNTAEPKEPTMYGFLEPWIGDGLLLSKGRKWARNRRLLTPAFHFEILKPYVEIYSSSALTMVNKWKKQLKEKSSFEMFENISLMMLDSLLKCAFGYESHCQTERERSPYVKAVYDLSKMAIIRMLNIHLHSDLLFYLSPTGYRFRKACGIVHNYSKGVIKARRQGKKEGDQPPDKKYLDFLDILLEAKDSDGKGMTDTEIQHEVDTFMFEGHDTTTSGLSWFLYNMARFPEFQHKCRLEINEVLGDRDDVMWDDLAKFEYLTQCLKESMRIHPPVPGISRQPTKDITLPDGKVIPKGVWVTVAIYPLHHNPAIWEDPEKFDPTRFTLENSKDRHPHAFVPFSAGPRNCIGQNFAMNELKTCAALLLKNFEFSVDESIPIVLWPEVILRSKDGIWLKIKPLD